MPNPGRPISLEGRVAIVTGGGRGLGRAHALALAAAGARVVVVDTGEALDGGSGEQGVAAAVVEEIRGAGGEAIASTEAVGSTKAAETLVATALDAYGRLDVLVNNAGISRTCLSRSSTTRSGSGSSPCISAAPSRAREPRSAR